VPSLQNARHNSRHGHIAVHTARVDAFSGAHGCRASSSCGPQRPYCTLLCPRTDANNGHWLSGHRWGLALLLRSEEEHGCSSIAPSSSAKPQPLAVARRTSCGYSCKLPGYSGPLRYRHSDTHQQGPLRAQDRTYSHASSNGYRHAPCNRTSNRDGDTPGWPSPRASSTSAPAAQAWTSPSLTWPNLLLQPATPAILSDETLAMG